MAIVEFLSSSFSLSQSYLYCTDFNIHHQFIQNTFKPTHILSKNTGVILYTLYMLTKTVDNSVEMCF